METLTTKTLELEFVLTNGEMDSLSLPDYKEDLTQETITAAAAVIIEQNVFQPGGYAYQKLKGYEFVDKTVRKMELE